MMRDISRVSRFPDWMVASFWIMVIIALWAWAGRFLAIPDYILPGPDQVFERIGSKPAYFAINALSTLKVISIGFLCGVAAAVPTGLALAKIRLLERSLYPLVVFLQAMPQIAIIPVLVIWFGFGLTPSAILVGFSVFFPVMVNAVAGLRSAPERLYFVTRAMGAGALQTFRFVEWPTMLPYLLSSFRIALAAATTVAVVAEFLAANEGLGFAALIGARNRDTVQVIAVVLITAIIGVALNSISSMVEAAFLRRYRS